MTSNGSNNNGMEQDWKFPLLLSFLAGASTCAGAAIVFVFNAKQIERSMSFSLSLAASVMITVSLISIGPEAMEGVIIQQRDGGGDYYYSFNGPLVYELAIIANDWCVNKNGSINARKYHSFINSYNSVRPITKKEMKQMNNAMIAAGLRFYLARLVDMIFPKVGEITHIKDPSAFENILKKRLENK